MRTLLALTLAVGSIVACSATDPFDGEMPAPAPTQSKDDSTPTTLFDDKPAKVGADLPGGGAKTFSSKDFIKPVPVELAKPVVEAVSSTTRAKQFVKPEEFNLAGASLQARLPCGASICTKGEVCCNESCGICTPPGGACTQQVCGPDGGQ